MRSPRRLAWLGMTRRANVDPQSAGACGCFRRKCVNITAYRGWLDLKENTWLEKSARNQAHGAMGPAHQRAGRAVQGALRRRSPRQDHGLESRAGRDFRLDGAMGETRRDFAGSLRGRKKRGAPAD